MILTDSMSVLDKVSSADAYGPEDMELLSVLNELGAVAQVHLRHVKAHNNITLNERADRLAAQGQVLEEQGQAASVVLQYDEVAPTRTGAICRDEYHAEWKPV